MTVDTKRFVWRLWPERCGESSAETPGVGSGHREGLCRAQGTEGCKSGAGRVWL